MSEVERRPLVAWGNDWRVGRVVFDALFKHDVYVGKELEPHESVLGVVTDSGGPQPYMVCTTRHARIVELLCADGDVVTPGQPLVVVEERDPTFDKYSALQSKYLDTNQELRQLKWELRTAAGAVKVSRRLARERRREERERRRAARQQRRATKTT